MIEAHGSVQEIKGMPTVQELNDFGTGYFPAHVGVVFTSADKEALRSELVIRPHLIAPNGYLHAGAIVTLADTTAGYGCRLWLPESAVGFTCTRMAGFWPPLMLTKPTPGN